MVEIPEIEELKELLKELGEEGLIKRLESFVRMNEGLESKRGEDFIKVSILGFAEGLLVVLKEKYEDPRVRELYEKIRAKRAELDEQFRKPRIPYLEEEP
ncbi:DUF3216 domain-containing protein [Thermococcus stetteri]|uniref:DUF3216 domain-containing protein n=1 Tax=Thermococcus stetteri TaxID=49900 RepID=UPI001AE4A1D3|nr:DUF3216 domain-containing protein [Thermococcus stetteri]